MRSHSSEKQYEHSLVFQSQKAQLQAALFGFEKLD